MTLAGLNLNLCRHGLLCHMSSDRVIGASLRAYGEWAEEELFLLSHLIRPGETVLDIGANIGTHALAFARFAGPTGTVIAIEAQQRALRLLSLNMILNQVDWVQPILGLVGRECRLRMAPEIMEIENNWGQVTFAGAPDPKLRGTALLLPLPEITVDSLELAHCDLMKIDVEGMEFETLKGAHATLSRHRPIVYFEQAMGAQYPAISALFGELGYDLFWHVAHPFNARNYRGGRENIFGAAREINVLAMPHERGFSGELRTLLGLSVATHEYAPVSEPTSAAVWSLPETAYSECQEPVAYRSQADLLSVPSLWYKENNLQLQFNALMEDRIKAQHIMEMLQHELLGLRATNQE